MFSEPVGNGLECKAQPGLAQLLWEKLELFGNAIAVESGDFLVTFSNLHHKAVRLAQLIQDHHVLDEEPIGILAPRGINHIVAQAAIVYAGGSCVPLDVDQPDSHLEMLLHNLRATLILTDTYHSHRLHNLKHIVLDHTFEHNAERSSELNKFQVSRNGPRSRTHIMHTSGSTGQPKAVQILGRGVLNLVFNEFDSVHRGHRLGHNCNVSFDVSIWEIWSSLLQGATIVVFERNVVLDPMVFAKQLRMDHIDVMWQTTSLLATVVRACPQAYATVDTLLTGGEAINLQTIRSIAANGPPRRLFNVYGPTECSVFTSFHQVTGEDIYRGHIPIGRPLSNYELFVVDEALQPVARGEVGELLVGGAGVSAGYFGNPKKTKEVFISMRDLLIDRKSSTNLVYRTGDLVRMNTRGEIEYLGRRDNEVKIRGQRIDMDSIESFLLQTKLVSATAALKVESDKLKTGAILLACVVPESGSIETRSIRQAFTQLAPNLMVPHIHVVESIVLSGSGKIDRKELARQYLDQFELARTTRSSGRGELVNDVETCLQDIWHDVLGLPVKGFKSSDDFFSLGGTSLQAAGLVSKIQQSFKIGIRVAALFENPTLREMCNLVHRIRNEDVPSDVADKENWVKDSQLGRGLTPAAGKPPNWQDKSEGRIFLTGATGFIGAFLLADLLRLPEVSAIACLVQAMDEDTAMIRITDTLQKYGLSPSSAEISKLLPLPGDLALSDFGLGWKRYDFYSAWASVVFHLGARVNFIEPYSTHRAANVLGTLNVIHFCNKNRLKGLHYTSSISAYGPTGLVTGAAYLPEDERPAAHLAALSYDTGYAQSQYVAEMVVWNAIENGLPINIYRPGFVLGHSKTGAVNSSDFFGRVIASCMRMGSYPVLAKQHEDFVPVDFVASALLHIASASTNFGCAYNLVPPDSSNLIDLSSSFELISKLSLGTYMHAIPYSDWLNHLSKAHDDPLQPLTPILEEKVLDSRTRWEMKENMPIFGTDNLRQALMTRPELLQLPSTGSLLQTCLPSWIRAASA